MEKRQQAVLVQNPVAGTTTIAQQEPIATPAGPSKMAEGKPWAWIPPAPTAGLVDLEMQGDAPVELPLNPQVEDQSERAKARLATLVRTVVPPAAVEPSNVVPDALAKTEKPGLMKNLAYFLVHSIRTGGYMPWLLLLLAKWPKQTAVALLVREILRRKTDTYNTLVHKFAAFGSSPEPRFVRRQTQPFDTSKQYMVTIHPHGILCCPWFNLLSKDSPDFHEKCTLMDDLKLQLCFAPAVQMFPLHGEIYRTRATDATAKTIKHYLEKTDLSPALAPGGFSEAVYSGSDPVKEYCFIEGRMGFLKLAIEHKVDIIPTYSYGSTDMYQSLEWGRHKRAVLAQKFGLPFLWWWGKNGTNIPFTEKLVTASFDPFPASQYTVDQLEQAHADYKEYLKKCFDSYKHEAGYGHREMEFIGRTVLPEKYQTHSKL